HLDDIAHGRVAAARAAEHLDAHQGARAAVVSGLEHCLQLDHGSFLNFAAHRLAIARLLDDLQQRPGLAARHRTAGGDDDQVTIFRRALIIVRQQLGRAPDELAVGRVLHQPLDLDRDGLLHLGADHPPGEPACALRFYLRFHLGVFRAHGLLASGLGRLLLPQHRLHARDVAARVCEQRRLGLLAGGPLHAQRELLLAQLHELLAQLGRGLLAQLLAVLLYLSDLHYRTCRFTKEVETESLEPARRNASRAVTSSTPSISKSTLPGCTRATQYSTLPLPLPMRTSSGFLEIGTSGNTRIQICPPRFTWRTMARTAAPRTPAVTLW